LLTGFLIFSQIFSGESKLTVIAGVVVGTLIINANGSFIVARKVCGLMPLPGALCLPRNLPGRSVLHDNGNSFPFLFRHTGCRLRLLFARSW